MHVVGEFKCDFCKKPKSECTNKFLIAGLEDKYHICVDCVKEATKLLDS